MSQYGQLLGAEVERPVVLSEHGVRVAFVTLENSKIELMTPLDAQSPLFGFLQRRPEGGMHHICFEVPDLEGAIATLVAGGARILGDGRPKIGAHGLPVVFLHPKDFFGTLIELEEVKPELQPG